MGALLTAVGLVSYTLDLPSADPRANGHGGTAARGWGGPESSCGSAPSPNAHWLRGLSRRPKPATCAPPRLRCGDDPGATPGGNALHVDYNIQSTKNVHAIQTPAAGRHQVLLQVHEGDRPAQTRRHPRRTAGVGATRTGAGAWGRRTGSLGNAAGEAGVELDPESEQGQGAAESPQNLGQGAAESPQQRKQRPGNSSPRLILNQVSEPDTCWRLLRAHRQEGLERFRLIWVHAPIPEMGTSLVPPPSL